MLVSQREHATLLLDDGTLYEGRAFGARTTIAGPIHFHTGMSGYEDIVRDPVYSGQVVVMTMPHIGNGGLPRDLAGKLSIAGIVVKKFSETLSSGEGAVLLGKAMEHAGVPGISDLDTRKLTKHLRQGGVRRAVLDTTGLPVEALREMLERPGQPGMPQGPAFREHGPTTARRRIAVVGPGLPEGALGQLVARDCRVGAFPLSATPKEVLDWAPDGILIDNGAGDPHAMPAAVDLVAALQKAGVPILGIGLGHQLLALANGVGLVDSRPGHHGNNHPVVDVATGRGEITSQDSSLVVDREQLSDHLQARIISEHANDHSVMGVSWAPKVFSVQYRAAARPGPWDSLYLFDRFIEQVEKQGRVAETA